MSRTARERKLRRLTQRWSNGRWRLQRGAEPGSSSESFSPWNAASWNGFSPWNRFTPRSENGHAPADALVPPKEDERLRFFTLNLAHGRKTATHQALLRRETAERNIDEIGRTLKALTPDVVALQEADGPSSWSGNFDHVETLARHANLVDHYRGNHNLLNLGRFNLATGTALLARQPLLEPSSHRFDETWRDTKGFVVATVAVPEWGGLEVDVVSVHLDFLAPRIRRRQVYQMIDKLLHRQRPLVVLGDLNCCFDRDPKTIRLLVETLDLRAYEPGLRAPTFPSHRPRRRLDWILISEELDYTGYHTVRLPLSDHLMLVADLHQRA